MNLVGNAVTDIGIKKKTNQDSLVLKIVRKHGKMSGIVVVCDGVSGLQKGESASATIVRGFAQWFQEVFLVEDREWNEKELRESISELINSLNQEIMSYGKEEGISLASTVTAVLFYEDRYYLAHIGDCRFYEIYDTVRQISKDHTWIAMELAKGTITREQAMNDPRKNMLLQSIGATENPDIFWHSGNLIQNSTYLVCSDGFRHLLTEDEIFGNLHPSKNQDVKQIGENLSLLIEKLKERGEKDNITAALVWVG